jgi:hypothetical protein
LSAWAVQSPSLPLDADMSPDTLVLAMRTHARPAASPAGTQTVSLALTDSRQQGLARVHYRAVMTAEATAIDRTPEVGHVDAAIAASTRDWKACIIGGIPLGRRPQISVTGNADAAARLVIATALTTLHNV